MILGKNWFLRSLWTKMFYYTKLVKNLNFYGFFQKKSVSDRPTNKKTTKTTQITVFLDLQHASVSCECMWGLNAQNKEHKRRILALAMYSFLKSCLFWLSNGQTDKPWSIYSFNESWFLYIFISTKCKSSELGF